MSDKGNTTTIESPLLEVFKKHPALVLTAVYVYLNILGMINAYRYFSLFGINIFKFSEINDFIMAVFRNPSFIILILCLLLYSILILLLRKLVYDKKPEKAPKESQEKFPAFLQPKWIENILRVIIILLIPPCFAWFEPTFQLFSSKNEPVTVGYRVANGQAGEGWSRDEVEHIGTTAKFMFFVDDNKCFMIVPTSNVQIIRERPPPQTEEDPPSENGGARASKLEECRKMVGTNTSTRSNQ